MLSYSRSAFLASGFLATLCTIMFTSTVTASDSSTATTLTLSAGEIDRENVPAIFNLSEELRDSETLYLSATDAVSILPIPTQRTPDGTQLVWMLQRPLAVGATRSYTLIASDTAPQESDRAPAVRLIQTDDEISIKVDDLPVLSYQIAVGCPPEDAPAYYARSGFIHPLMTPSGKILTDDFPPDHFHQHAIFFAWVNTTFQDRRIDFWNQAKEEGNVRHVKVIDTCQGDVFAEFTVALAHDAFNEDDTIRALDETWTVRVYRRTDGFLVDFTSRQECAGESPLLMNEYHYGGMGFRGARHWTDLDQAGFLTSEGRSREDGNHTRPNWVDAFGPFDDGPAGTTILCHPDNFRSPQSVRLHPSMPYFCFAPCVDGEFSISPGNVHESRYRFLTHDGPVDPAVADIQWEDYAKPLIAE